MNVTFQGEQNENMTVLITGSSRGIGYAIAREFACQPGNLVILNGRTDQIQLNKAMETLNAPGYLADVSDYNQAKALFEDIYKDYGCSIDILINNAGISHFGLFSDTTPHDWDEILRHNLYSTLNATHLAIPNMIRNKRGVIINISSIWGSTGASCEAIYAAAKGAVHAFTKSMAQELGPSGIRVNAIACGAIDTRMNERLTNEEQLDFTEKIPLMRFGTTTEVGKLAKFLASDESSYITGQILGLNGGIV